MKDSVETPNASVEKAYNLIAEDTTFIEVPPVVDEPVTPDEPAADTANLADEVIEDTMDMAIALLDNANRLVFTAMARKKLKKRVKEIDAENGYTRLQQLRSDINANSGKKNGVQLVETYTGKDAQLLNIDAVVDEFIEQLPFSEAEIKMMRPGLRAMVVKNAGKVPPEIFFYAGLATTIGGNYLEYNNI